MTLKERLGEDMKRAMKSADKDRLGVLRMLRSRILDSEVASRASKGRGYELTDDEVVEVLVSYSKQRRDSIEAFRQASRPDLVLKEEAELAIVQEYLPEALEENELHAIVTRAIAESGARSAREMGAVMKLVMPRIRGRAEGKRVQEIVRGMLAE
jgi:hypothetical protein